MLEAIGIESTDQLFETVPAKIRATGGLDLPAGLSEYDVAARMSALAGKNQPLPGFAGAGCYRHFVPSTVSQVLSRSEFATAYTPYQPEVSQGTLQAVFEFQTYAAILTGLDVANASMYDGASAFAESLLMALRVGRKRDRLVVSAGIHPEYLETAQTYLDGFGRGEIVVIGLGADGRPDAAALEAAVDDRTAAVCSGYPNFVGVIEDLSQACGLAKRAGALSISVTTEALALALLRAPGSLGVDVAVAEGLSLGLSASYGGPGLGLFAARDAHVRQMPGRLVGETVDEEGRRGYVLTLATREQHIRREKATSNICTNQALAALASTVYLGLNGRQGLRELAALNASRAHTLAARLENEVGLQRAFSGPFFNEFAVRVADCEAFCQRAFDAGFIAGVPAAVVGRGRSEFDDLLLIAVTECNTEADSEELLQVVREKVAA